MTGIFVSTQTNMLHIYARVNFKTSSPYAIPSVTLQLKDASRLYHPAHLLEKSHTLSSLDKGGVYHLDISHDVAHIFVNYLFTDTYQCLRSKGSSPNEKLVAEFLTSIHVYIAARDYKLLLLEELAQAEITKLGNEFRIPLVFDLVQEAYPNPNMDDTWFCQYLKSRLSILFTEPKELLEWDPSAEQRVATISDILLKNMLELLRENVISSHILTNGALNNAQKDPPKVNSVPEPSPEPLKSDDSEKAHTLAFELNSDHEPARSDVETKKSDFNASKNDVDIGKSDSSTNKSDDEITRNGVQTPVSKSESCEPEISKGDHLVNEFEHGVKAPGEKKDEKDFWGLSLKKKKKKKKAIKGLVPESLQEGVTVKT